MSDRYPSELVESVEALSRLVLSEEDLSSTSDRIVKLAVHAVEGAEDCSISLARGGEIITIASTSDVGTTIDRLQYETKQGPCLSSIADHAIFRIPEMERDETWPTFSKRAAAETGTKSMLAFVLKVQEEALGGLNMSSSKVDAFDEEDIAMGTLFAAQAGVTLANALTHAANLEKVGQLEEGIKTRQMIGQAVGILMTTHHVDPDAAFDILKRISQSANIKLRDIAQDLVSKSGDL